MSSYTKDGYRVIALATKELPEISFRQVQRIERAEVESDLVFLGLLIMENKLKQETIGVIENLNQCQIRTIMATGDNVLTAISVARQCGITHSERIVYLADLMTDSQTGKEVLGWKSTIPALKVDAKSSDKFSASNNLSQTFDEMTNSGYDEANQPLQTNERSTSLPWHYKDSSVEVALTGKAFRLLESQKDQRPFEFKSVIAKAQVFARMSPDDKALLVSSLQNHLLD